MNAKETIQSWKWRIVKAGYNASNFSNEIGIPQSLLSEYMNGKKKPSIERFDLIEGRLQEMGV